MGIIPLSSGQLPTVPDHQRARPEEKHPRIHQTLPKTHQETLPLSHQANIQIRVLFLTSSRLLQLHEVGSAQVLYFRETDQASSQL